MTGRLRYILCRDLERGYPGGDLGEGQAGGERANLLQLREKRGHLCCDYIETLQFNYSKIF